MMTIACPGEINHLLMTTICSKIEEMKRPYSFLYAVMYLLGSVIYILTDFFCWSNFFGSGQFRTQGLTVLFFSLLALAIIWIATLLLEKWVFQPCKCKNLPQYVLVLEKTLKVIRLISIIFWVSCVCVYQFQVNNT